MLLTPPPSPLPIKWRGGIKPVFALLPSPTTWGKGWGWGLLSVLWADIRFANMPLRAYWVCRGRLARSAYIVPHLYTYTPFLLIKVRHDCSV